MTNIIGLKELVSFLGDKFRINFAGQVTLVPGETITQGSATAVVSRTERDGEAVVIPTSDEYFEAGSSFTTDESEETGTLTLLSCELTALKIFHDGAKRFIEQYTGKEWGATSSKTIEPQVKEGMRYYFFNDAPVNSITSVTYNGTTLTEDTDFYLKENRYLDFGVDGLAEPNEPDSLVIVYNKGESSVNANVKRAAAIYIEYMWQLRNRNQTTKGANTISFGGRTVNWSLNPQSTEIEGIKPEMSAILKKESKIRMG